MTEKAEPKRKRVYTGKDLERRQAYQRAYNQKKRDEAKMSNRKKPKPHQAPMAQTPDKPSDYVDIRVKQHDSLADELERDLQDANASSYNLEFFSQFVKKAGE